MTVAVLEASPKDRAEVVTTQAEMDHQEVVICLEDPAPQAAVGRLGAGAAEGMKGDLYPVTAGGAAAGAATPVVQEVNPARDRRVIGDDALADVGA